MNTTTLPKETARLCSSISAENGKAWCTGACPNTELEYYLLRDIVAQGYKISTDIENFVTLTIDGMLVWSSEKQGLPHGIGHQTARIIAAACWVAEQVEGARMPSIEVAFEANGGSMPLGRWHYVVTSKGELKPGDKLVLAKEDDDD